MLSPVAQQIAVALDHVADGDADAEIHLPLSGRPRCEVRERSGLLDVDRRAHLPLQRSLRTPRGLDRQPVLKMRPDALTMKSSITSR